MFLHPTSLARSTSTAARRFGAWASLALLLLLTCGCGGGGGGGGGPESEMSAAKLLIEHNFTDEDTGFQGFADGDPWNELSIVDADGVEIVHANAQGGLYDFGLTELFFETSEPENAEVPIADVLALLPVGEAEMTGDMVEGDPQTLGTPFTHKIPEGPTLTSPTEGESGLDPDAVTVEWEAVDQDIDGGPVAIVGYQVIVEKNASPEFPEGFAKPWLSVYVPANATQVTVPQGFLEDDACYKWEVLAIEASGNQTLASGSFETGVGCVLEIEPEEEDPILTAAKILIEHNGTDEDTGFQGFADGDPWNELTITGPGGQVVVTVTAGGSLLDFGLTELFFETSEPENSEEPIPEVLARLPAGIYTFRGVMVDGSPSTLTALLTHTIPAVPALLSPADGAANVDPADTVVSWTPVTTALGGGPVDIVGYQVIVEEDAEPAFPEGFAKPVFAIFLPASASSVRVPAEFMRAGTAYKYEVLAIEVSGNQTLSVAAFQTQ